MSTDPDKAPEAPTVAVLCVARGPQSTTTGAVLARGDKADVPRDGHTEAQISAGHFLELDTAKTSKPKPTTTQKKEGDD